MVWARVMARVRVGVRVRVYIRIRARARVTVRFKARVRIKASVKVCTLCPPIRHLMTFAGLCITQILLLKLTYFAFFQTLI